MTIERMLQNDMTETEFFNMRRLEHGRKATGSHVTKIRPDLVSGCGQNCKVTAASHEGFIIRHDDTCSINRAVTEDEVVRRAKNGQAVAMLRDDDDSIIIGVIVLNGLFPHEEPKIVS